MGQYDLALAAHQAALRNDPALVESHYDLSALYNQLGRHRETIAAYEQRLRLGGEDARTRYNLGLTYIQLGALDAARGQYEELRLLDPGLAERLAPYFSGP